VLQYDDVMNRQREIIYSERRKVLQGEDLKDYIFSMIEKVIDEVRQSPTLASTLGKVCTWKVEGNQLRLSCDSNYAMRKLKEDVAILKEKVSEVLGTRLEIKVEVQDTSLTAEEEHQSRDDQVELVKKVFRGEIVDGVE